MASRRIITNRRSSDRRVTGALLVLVLLMSATVHAHGPDTRGSRVLVRLQGYRVGDSATTPSADEIVLSARGIAHRFRVTDRRVFEMAQPSLTPLSTRDRLALQGDFDVLARFAKARPDQQITILGEQRMESSDLFILTLDVCPP